MAEGLLARRRERYREFGREEAGEGDAEGGQRASGRGAGCTGRRVAVARELWARQIGGEVRSTGVAEALGGAERAAAEAPRRCGGGGGPGA